MTGESYYLTEKKDGFENARCFIQDHNGFFWIGTTEGVLSITVMKWTGLRIY